MDDDDYVRMPTLSEFLNITKLTKYEGKLKKAKCKETDDLDQIPNVGMLRLEEIRIKRYLKYFREKRPTELVSKPQPITLDNFYSLASLTHRAKDMKKLGIEEFDDLNNISPGDLTTVIPLKIEAGRFRRYVKLIEENPDYEIVAKKQPVTLDNFLTLCQLSHAGKGLRKLGMVEFSDWRDVDTGNLASVLPLVIEQDRFMRYASAIEEDPDFVEANAGKREQETRLENFYKGSGMDKHKASFKKLGVMEIYDLWSVRRVDLPKLTPVEVDRFFRHRQKIEPPKKPGRKESLDVGENQMGNLKLSDDPASQPSAPQVHGHTPYPNPSQNQMGGPQIIVQQQVFNTHGPPTSPTHESSFNSPGGQPNVGFPQMQMPTPNMYPSPSVPYHGQQQTPDKSMHQMPYPGTDPIQMPPHYQGHPPHGYPPMMPGVPSGHPQTSPQQYPAGSGYPPQPQQGNPPFNPQFLQQSPQRQYPQQQQFEQAPVQQQYQYQSTPSATQYQTQYNSGPTPAPRPAPRR